MQYATPIKIMDIRPCVSPVSFHYLLPKKMLQEAPQIRFVHQKRLFADPPEPMNFLGARSSRNFLKKRSKTHRIPQKLCGQHPVSSGPFDKMATQDPGSVKIPDPAELPITAADRI